MKGTIARRYDATHMTKTSITPGACRLAHDAAFPPASHDLKATWELLDSRDPRTFVYKGILAWNP